MKRITYGILLLLLLVPMILTSCSKSEEAQAVDDMIAAIGEVTKDSESSIQKAEEAYTQLEDADKKSLSNYGKLQKARTAYDTLCAQEVDELIEKIGTVTLDSKKDIETVLNKYDSLTENQKGLVSKSERISEIEDEYRDAQINEVEHKIDAIGEVVFTRDCRDAILDAKNSYDKLSADEQKDVTNYSVLIQCENEFSTLGISTTEQLINAIGEVKYSDECKNAIYAAEEAYLLNTISAREQITNYDVLTAAREKYDTLTPVQLNSYRISSTFLGTSELYLNATNVTDKIIKEFTFRIFAYDNDNLPVNLSSFGYDTTERLTYSEALKGGNKVKSNAYWYLSASSRDIRKLVAYVEEVEFYDGDIWENPNNTSLYSKYNEKILEENDVNILKRG